MKMDAMTSMLYTLVRDCHLPEVKHGNDRPIASSDFTAHIEKLETSMDEIVGLLNSPQMADVTLMLNKELLIDIIILFGENFDVFPWNSRQIVLQTQQACQIVKEKMGYIDEEDILVKGISIEKQIMRPLLRPILLKLRPKLLKTSWKRYPASVQAYVWLINSISFPNLGDFVQDVLPTALLLTDDFVNENRVLGVRCLSRIINNITIAELKYHGYGQLMYKAMEHLLRERNADLASVTIPSIFTLVTKLETDFGDVDISQKWSRYDDVLEILLEIIELEQLIELRNVYISFIEFIIVNVGSRILRWSKRVIRLLDHYLDISVRNADHPTMSHSLKALKEFLLLSGPLQKYYFQDVTFCLLRTFHHLTTSAQNCAHSEVQTLCEECAKLILERCSSDEKECFLSQIEHLEKDGNDCLEFTVIKRLIT